MPFGQDVEPLLQHVTGLTRLDLLPDLQPDGSDRAHPGDLTSGCAAAACGRLPSDSSRKGAAAGRHTLQPPVCAVG
jgi:hypothetical protein